MEGVDEYPGWWFLWSLGVIWSVSLCCVIESSRYVPSRSVRPANLLKDNGMSNGDPWLMLVMGRSLATKDLISFSFLDIWGSIPRGDFTVIQVSMSGVFGLELLEFAI